MAAKKKSTESSELSRATKDIAKVYRNSIKSIVSSVIRRKKGSSVQTKDIVAAINSSVWMKSELHAAEALVGWMSAHDGSPRIDIITESFDRLYDDVYDEVVSVVDVIPDKPRRAVRGVSSDNPSPISSTTRNSSTRKLLR